MGVTHCVPYITNECFGSNGLLHQSTCSNGELSEGFYFGSSCSVDNLEFNDTFGGDDSACKDDDDDGVYTYYQIDCNPDLLPGIFCRVLCMKFMIIHNVDCFKIYIILYIHMI